jgi:hypothetical protein
MTGIIGLSIFGFISGLMNGFAYYEYKRTKKKGLLVFQTILSFFILGILIISITSDDGSYNNLEKLGLLIIPPSIWYFTFRDGYKGNKINNFTNNIKNTFGRLFEIVGSFLGIVLIIIIFIVIILLLVKLVKYFWYL